jgi:5'-nucleotidase
VALVVLGLLGESVDMVISGINPNANVGHDVTYSGTVTAAMEASLAGINGIAFSLDTPDDIQEPVDYDPAATIAARLVQKLANRSLPKGLLLNVNIPYRSSQEIKGLAITRQGLRVYRDALDERKDPRGKSYYWIGGDSPTGVPDPGTDFWALSEGMVSITPLKMDLTAHDWIQTLQGWDLQIERNDP